MDVTLIGQQVQTVVAELAQAGKLTAGKLMVIGCSTSEVLGKHIGKAGSEEVGAALYRGILAGQAPYGFSVAFQCCEHLNRALVMERSTAERYGYDEVTVIPVPAAGGSMAAYAYSQMTDPVVVEHIRADAGIDIGDTFIGMHLKHVAVPFRPSLRSIGEAHLTAAFTRPKLIGGVRAVYERTDANNSCS
ncbi:TIGR01440 family protein [Brevibacillus dissolubilis]|uniref:TIGR01440 family protein n=1 Tax=Brevibacillus dissolubilis TaxID=1844116 RepID=UPI0011173486|nr:TIGR01440 family protein [Brevibacillus dissolubilis]